ncbi:NUDIX hydrolase [Foetidibacter luteolus]|uniref:NUDIX hydrolase n=1 Tax=Foetidibacter luteolus TaxID=2608880 RepID=UPI001A99A978|nr:NUDIX domain-containing protein [Foetidibacter luteolus]
MQPTIIAAGGLVLNDKEELLLMFRRGKWDLPKGKLDEGESIEECAIREVMEETGLVRVELVKPVGITYHDYFDKYSKQDVTKESHWFEMRAPGEQQFIPQTEEDIEQIIWTDRKQLKKCLSNSYKNIIEILSSYYLKKLI